MGFLMKWAERHFNTDLDTHYASARVKEKARASGVTIPDAVSDHVIPVCVNQGRWIVPCPCGNAEFAWKGKSLHLCTHCWNAFVGYRWVKVKWPRSWQKIEKLLDLRPFPRNRNWQPGETLKQLAKENKDHGVPYDLE